MELPPKPYQPIRTQDEIQRIKDSGIDIDEINIRNLVYVYSAELLYLSKGRDVGKRIPSGIRAKLRKAGILEKGGGTDKTRIRITDAGMRLLNEEIAK